MSVSADAILYVLCAGVQMEESSDVLGNDEYDGMSNVSESSSDSESISDFDLDSDVDREKVCRIFVHVVSWSLNTGY